jgi:16S rRNA (adenine1518-N6/adenine1519-N6)-dimethyltransferase
LKAKKSFGQHFLKEESISQRIANSLRQLEQYHQILEVGPGMGMLTKYLLQIPNHQLSVVEADTDMVDYLKVHYPQLLGHIISDDFLKVDLESFYKGEQFAIIGNFPYNISSQIMIKALDNRDSVPEVVGMFQREVAERIAAGPGNKEYGVLSVLMQAYYDIKYLFTVKPGSFNPPPKVMSGVIALIRKENYKELGCNDNLFRILVKASFNQRRKMLRNSLKAFLPKEVIESDSFYELRPEQLTIQQFVFLTNQVENYRNKVVE